MREKKLLMKNEGPWKYNWSPRSFYIVSEDN